MAASATSAAIASPAAPPRPARLQAQPGDRRRLLVIVRHALPLLVSFRRDVRRWIWWGGPEPRTPAFHVRRARRLVDAVTALGPAFVKLAQIFAARADLIPEPYLSQLATLTDRVAPVPWPAIERALRESYGDALPTLFDEIDPEPLAAGSLGQVHRARVRGREVVVKVLRPGVEEVVRRDARLAIALTDRVYARFPHHHVRGVRVVLEEFQRRVEEEMDFRREARQCERMRERFADDRRIRIPRTEPALTRQRTMVLEFMRGTRIDALDAHVADGRVDARRLAETLIETYARMMLRDGVFHADPHPGNLLVDDQGAIVLLDFGMVIDVDTGTRQALFETILAAIRRDVPRTVSGFYRLGLVADGTPVATMEALAATLLEIAYDEGTTVERARVLADRVMAELFDWPIVLPGELVYFARTAALIEGVGARYDAAFNSIAVASPVVLRMRREIVRTLFGGDGTEDGLVAAARGLGVLAGTAVSWWRERGPSDVRAAVSRLVDAVAGAPPRTPTP
ncbi:MAG TPA: AarF/UbiB family protein [Gemmatimonadaceae bacterium]|nr:AarF/UbiB family protein [Gemmatimonadaceae bacterium]